jgi:hypothetical protein
MFYEEIGYAGNWTCDPWSSPAVGRAKEPSGERYLEAGWAPSEKWLQPASEENTGDTVLRKDHGLI